MGDPVFLHYDRAALDREYDNRAKVASSADVLAWYARQSASTRGALPCRLDVPYGAHPGETLDIFLPPSGPSPAPVQLFIHGGYWQRLDKSDFSYVARAFQPVGAAVVVINYALMPAVDMDELVRQCRASAAWVYRNAATFGADPDRIFVSGHSAGGHLVAMLLAPDWPRFEPGLPAGLVKGGGAISGLYDLEPIRLCYLNDVLALTAEAARRNSPVHLIPPAPRPLLVAVGEREGSEYHRQVDALVTPWRRHGVACEVLDMAGHDHFSIMVDLDDPAAELSRTIQRQMGLGPI
jgi:arylformamidase